LPGVPKHDQRKTEHQKQDQSSVIHYCLGSDSGQKYEASAEANAASIGNKHSGHNWKIRESDHTRPDARGGNARLVAQTATGL
jgi:hypothetical protein